MKLIKTMDGYEIWIYGTICGRDGCCLMSAQATVADAKTKVIRELLEMALEASEFVAGDAIVIKNPTI